MKDEIILLALGDKNTGLELQRRIEKFGYRVADVVKSGNAAAAAAGAILPDLVLMEVKPGGGFDGIEAAKSIKARLRIPVVFLTSDADEDMLERAKTAEPLGYVLKPYKGKELSTTIKNAMKIHRERNAAFRSLRGETP